jgi:hypothetical protein
MTEHEDLEPGFRVTIKDVYMEVRALKDIIDGRLRKVEAQIAAQWVVVGIIIVAVGTLAVRGITI